MTVNKFSSKLSMEFEVLRRKPKGRAGENRPNLTTVEDISVSEMAESRPDELDAKPSNGTAAMHQDNDQSKGTTTTQIQGTGGAEQRLIVDLGGEKGSDCLLPKSPV